MNNWVNNEGGAPLTLRGAVLATTLAHQVATRIGARVRDERGEGVISVAIAVLIMAALGALVWVAFRGFWESTESKTQSNLDQIGG